MLLIAPERSWPIKTTELKNLPMENITGAPIKPEVLPDIQSVSLSPRKDFEMPRARNRGSVNMLEAAQKEMVKEALDLGKENEDGEEERNDEKVSETLVKTPVSTGKAGTKARSKK